MVTHNSTLMIAVTGASGSGKTTVAEAIFAALPRYSSQILSDDHYYLTNGGQPGRPAAEVDFDDPASKDLALLGRHLTALRRGEPVERPAYCFERHERRPGAVPLAPTPILLVEGIHVLCSPGLADLFDITVYVDAPADISLIRRLRRDVAERGRSWESVIDQYEATVRPAFLAHIAPARSRAGLVVSNAAQAPGGPELSAVVDEVLARVRALRPGLF
jgi:uridine kinase